MIKYQTVFENNNFLVINKPAGLLVHSANHIKEPTLADQLLKKYPELIKIGEDPIRPGIMHRLDKQVSGLMAVAKTQVAFDHLKKQFQDRTIIKIYTALVYGKIEKDEDEINFPIQRSSKGHKMAALPLTTKGKFTEEGRQAITEFEVIKRFINYTLLKVKIKTGRTHQIRVHLAAYGHPVVGDDLYSTKKTKEKNKKLNLGRIFLVANKLSFIDLNGKQKTFKIDLPEELKNFLKKIK
ncbi:RNA pseudouridine synthase [Candidatus Parcubacteria bacterium]|nr:RNA pseudouridine synthase [Candidatus Parcubacteria bacterium]